MATEEWAKELKKNTTIMKKTLVQCKSLWDFGFLT